MRHRASSMPLVALWLCLVAQPAAAQFINFAQTDPQRAVARVLDSVCGVSATGELQTQCDSFTGVLGNGGENLTLQQFAHEEYAAAGNLAIEFADRQRNEIYARIEDLHDADDTDTRATFSQRGLGVFLAPTFAFGDQDGSRREDAFDLTSGGVVVGVDQWLGERAIVGAAFQYERRDLEFDSNGRVSRGEVESNAYGLSLYGSLDTELVRLDGVASFVHSDLKQERRLLSQTTGYGLNRTARSDTSSQTYSAALTASRDFVRDAFVLTPFAELGYQAVRINGFAETGSGGLNLRVDPQDVHSLQSWLGLRLSYALSTEVGVLLPQLRAGWRHEYLDDDRDIDARFLLDTSSTDVSPQTDDPDRDFFVVGVGLSFTLPRGLQPYVDYDTVLGLRDVSNHMVRAGLRVEL